MEEILPELKQFIINFCKVNKIKNAGLKDLSLSTSVDLELNIFGLTMDLFVTDFITKFNIDYSDFSWKKYGYPEESFLVGIFRLVFGFQQKRINQVLKLIYRPKFFIYNLQEALKTKKLK